MRAIIASTIVSLLTALKGCGSLTTNIANEHTVVSNLSRQNSHCESIPRIYSGVAYNVCMMNSSPQDSYHNYIKLGLTIIDTAACTLADTLFLPYSAYQQSRRGSIDI